MRPSGEPQWVVPLSEFPEWFGLKAPNRVVGSPHMAEASPGYDKIIKLISLSLSVSLALSGWLAMVSTTALRAVFWRAAPLTCTILPWQASPWPHVWCFAQWWWRSADEVASSPSWSSQRWPPYCSSACSAVSRHTHSSAQCLHSVCGYCMQDVLD